MFSAPRLSYELDGVTLSSSECTSALVPMEDEDLSSAELETIRWMMQKMLMSQEKWSFFDVVCSLVLFVSQSVFFLSFLLLCCKDSCLPYSEVAKRFSFGSFWRSATCFFVCRQDIFLLGPPGSCLACRTWRTAWHRSCCTSGIEGDEMPFVCMWSEWN